MILDTRLNYVTYKCKCEKSMEITLIWNDSFDGDWPFKNTNHHIELSEECTECYKDK